MYIAIRLKDYICRYNIDFSNLLVRMRCIKLNIVACLRWKLILMGISLPNKNAMATKFLIVSCFFYVYILCIATGFPVSCITQTGVEILQYGFSHIPKALAQLLVACSMVKPYCKQRETGWGPGNKAAYNSQGFHVHVSIHVEPL